MFNLRSEFIENIIEKKSYTVNPETPIKFPMKGEILSLDVKSFNSQNSYLVDINKKYAVIERITFQDRYKKSIILLRLDIGNRPHTNPNGKNISGNHIHIYSDGYNESYAFELDDPVLQSVNPNFDLNRFKTKNHIELFKAFSDFCNISNFPSIEDSFL